MFMCVRCGRFADSPTCPDCVEAIAADSTPERVIGRQPAVCEAADCGVVFEAARYGHRFHASACRKRAWRARRRVA